MKKTLVLSLCLIFAMASLALAKNVPGTNLGSSQFTESPAAADLSSLPSSVSARPMLRSAVADTFHLAWFSFDVGGLPNAQGWAEVDNTQQLKSYFHVASGLASQELTGGTFGALLPITGNQSMWCGQRAITLVADPEFADFCGWSALPGYGNSWNQNLESKDLSACDSVILHYKIFWDSEPGYDATTVETFSAGAWSAVGTVNGGAGFYDGTGSATEWVLLPAGTERVRFHFVADGAWSDEDGLWPTDGAVMLDSISIVWFNTGPPSPSGTFFEDFEGEVVGATVTDDLCWTAKSSVPFGEFGALYLGVGVLQEDPCFTNFTNLWAWFDPAGTDYICPGPAPIPVENHPGTKQIPFGPSVPGTGGLYMDNAIWSPMIPNVGAGSQYNLTFLTYRDLPLDNLQFYTWSVRSIDASGCPGNWKNDNFVFFGAQKDWLRTNFNIGVHIDPLAVSLQLQIGVVDACGFWCGIFGTGVCHSHAPLMDEVHLMRTNVVGPQYTVRHLDLFQDNFADDGTTTGHGRADSANDIAPSASPTIQPGDSVSITIAPVGTDLVNGGPSAYVYVAVWPQGQLGKTPADIEAPETRGALGKRWPLVGTQVHDGVTWGCYRMDSAITTAGAAVTDRYCIDLNDWVFTPCDTICYVFCADDGVNPRTYQSRRLNGAGANFVTTDLWEALNSPHEFQILPGGGWKNGGDVLYVDDSDDRGGPLQLFFDTAFQQIGILDKVDRYDVLGPSSNVSNGLASRVKNVFTQIMPCYKKIIWCSGNLNSGLIGDGSGLEKSDSYALLNTFLDNSPSPGGLYFSGDGIHEELAGLLGASAVDFRTRLYTYSLVDGSHVNAGEAVSPLLTAVGACFVHGGVPDQLIAFGGCPLINAFDVMNPTGTTQIEFPYPGGSGAAILSNADSNLVGSVMGIVGSGFSYHYIRDKDATSSLARSEHLVDILRWLGNVLPDPVGIDPVKLARNALGNAYPNPFNPTTTIDYSIKDAGHVSLKVYNVAGQLVRTLVNGVQTPKAQGEFFNKTWDGRNNAGQSVSTGVYFYKLVTNNFSQTKKMVLLK